MREGGAPYIERDKFPRQGKYSSGNRTQGKEAIVKQFRGEKRAGERGGQRSLRESREDMASKKGENIGR